MNFTRLFEEKLYSIAKRLWLKQEQPFLGRKLRNRSCFLLIVM